MSRVQEKLSEIRMSYVDKHAFDSGVEAYKNAMSDEIISMQQQHYGSTPHDDPYFVGIYNGMELVLSVLTGLNSYAEPKFMDVEKSKDIHNYKNMIEKIILQLKRFGGSVDLEKRVASIIGEELIGMTLDINSEACQDKGNQ